MIYIMYKEMFYEMVVDKRCEINVSNPCGYHIDPVTCE